MRIRHADDFEVYEVTEELDFASVDNDAPVLEYTPASDEDWDDPVLARAIADDVLEELVP